MSFRSLIIWSLNVRFRIPSPRLSSRAALLALLGASLGLSTGCDRLKAAVGGGGSAYVDPWQADSTLLASSPALLFRVMDHKRGLAVAPLATLGKGFRRLRMTDRGWKAFDLNYLQEGHTLEVVRDGHTSGTLRMTRGFWTADGQLDTIPRNNCKVPAGLGQAPPGTKLAVTGYRPKLNPTTPLSEAELSAALSKVPTLIAPSLGVAASMLGRYQREVHVMNTGVTGRPTIFIRYNDPEEAPDSVQLTGQRPRQLIIILDKSTYGYRPSYLFGTVGVIPDARRQSYLDYLDIDNDGKAEILLSAQQTQLGFTFDVVVALRAEGEIWKPFWEAASRCFG